VAAIRIMIVAGTRAAIEQWVDLLAISCSSRNAPTGDKTAPFD